MLAAGGTFIHIKKPGKWYKVEEKSLLQNFWTIWVLDYVVVQDSR